jgi:LmbE family N-acetylglucosaminyl deacetylase
MCAASPRTVLIAAHPDDETIGAAIRISQTPGISIVHATEGSPPNRADALAAGCFTREQYAAVRRQEAVRALALVGVRPDAITNLGFTDQRVSFELESLTLQILTLLGKFQPQVVLTHCYEGGHPDHDSIAFACRTAKKLHELDDPKSRFDLIEFTGYHAESGGIKPYAFLPFKDQAEVRYPLSPAERALKVTMLQEFKTQATTLAPFMLPEAEIFRQAPDYDFQHPPHSGRLFYEYFDWGVDGTTWRDLAYDAEQSFEGSRERMVWALQS